MNLERITSNRLRIGALVIPSGGRSNVALNSAFVLGTSGAAVAVRYCAPVAGNIDELYVFLDDAGGTLGSITMEAKIYNGSANTTRPGTTVLATSTATAMPGAVDKWIKFTFGTPYNCALGEIVWLLVYNTSASPSTNYPSVLCATNASPGGENSSANPFCGFSSSNGFSSNGTVQSELPYVVVQNGIPTGQPFTQRAYGYASNTRERGIQITAPCDIVVVGMQMDFGNVAYTAFRVLADDTAPGGSALSSVNLNSNLLDEIGIAWLSAPITLAAGTTYKCTLTLGNTVSPTCYQIEDYASYSSLFDTLRGYDELALPWSVVDNGAGGWTIDKSICPGIALIISDFPAATAGGVDFPDVMMVGA